MHQQWHFIIREWCSSYKEDLRPKVLRSCWRYLQRHATYHPKAWNLGFCLGQWKWRCIQQWWSTGVKYIHQQHLVSSHFFFMRDMSNSDAGVEYVVWVCDGLLFLWMQVSRSAWDGISVQHKSVLQADSHRWQLWTAWHRNFSAKSWLLQARLELWNSIKWIILVIIDRDLIYILTTLSVLYYGIGLWAMEFFQLISMHHVKYVLMLIVGNNRYGLCTLIFPFVNRLFLFQQNYQAVRKI